MKHEQQEMLDHIVEAKKKINECLAKNIGNKKYLDAAWKHLDLSYEEIIDAFNPLKKND
jgi:hypothetical protein